jgi:hypothetical protein
MEINLKTDDNKNVSSTIIRRIATKPKEVMRIQTKIEYQME